MFLELLVLVLVIQAVVLEGFYIYIFQLHKVFSSKVN